jgi:hypothetical protein
MNTFLRRGSRETFQQNEPEGLKANRNTPANASTTSGQLNPFPESRDARAI